MRVTEKTQLGLEQIAEINLICFREGDERASLSTLQYAFEHDDIFVDELCPGVWRAFAIVSLGSGQPYIKAIATRPQCRGRGIAGGLLDEIVDYYRGKEYIDLTCRVDNPAQKLYFDHGFRAKTVIRNAYDGKIDGLKMRRML